MAVINYRNVFAIILSFSVLLIYSILIVPSPSFADRIVALHQGTTLAVGCELNDRNLIDTTKVLKYDQPTRSIINCERSGGDIDLNKAEGISLRCLHDSPITIPKYIKMKAGELFYILCNVK